MKDNKTEQYEPTARDKRSIDYMLSRGLSFTSIAWHLNTVSGVKHWTPKLVAETANSTDIKAS